MGDENKQRRIWIQGLKAAAITGAASSVLVGLGGGALGAFRDFKGLAFTVGLSTLVAVAAYLKQSPLPYYDFEGGDVKTAPTPKQIQAAVIVGFLCLFGFGGCVAPVTPSSSTPAPVVKQVKALTSSQLFSLKAGATALGSSVILSSNVPADRTQRVQYLTSAAKALRAFSGDQAPSSQELLDLLDDYAPSVLTGDWNRLVSGLAFLYDGVRANLPVNGTQVRQVLQALSEGLEFAARSSGILSA